MINALAYCADLLVMAVKALSYTQWMYEEKVNKNVEHLEPINKTFLALTFHNFCKLDHFINVKNMCPVLRMDLDYKKE